MWLGGGRSSRATHVVICVSMKMRMKTSRAGRQQANIIQMGNSPLEPRGLMIQPRLSGLVTEKPRGTLSFCHKGETARRLASMLWGQMDAVGLAQWVKVTVRVSLTCV